MTVFGCICITAAIGVAGYVILYPDKAVLHYSRPRRKHSCDLCRFETAIARLRRRVLALRTPGPGRAARVRHALTWAEWEARRELGMAVNHPDWLTGVSFKELLAEMEAETWEER